MCSLYVVSLSIMVWDICWSVMCDVICDGVWYVMLHCVWYVLVWCLMVCAGRETSEHKVMWRAVVIGRRVGAVRWPETRGAAIAQANVWAVRTEPHYTYVCGCGLWHPRLTSSFWLNIMLLKHLFGRVLVWHSWPFTSHVLGMEGRLETGVSSMYKTFIMQLYFDANQMAVLMLIRF